MCQIYEFIRTSRGEDEDGRCWRHFENDHVYIALNDGTNSDRQQYPYEGIGINHLGFIINDGEQLSR